MKPASLLVTLAAAFVVAACSSVTGPSSGAPRTASISSGGQCLLEGSACRTTGECCSQFCANFECVTRDP